MKYNTVICPISLLIHNLSYQKIENNITIHYLKLYLLYIHTFFHSSCLLLLYHDIYNIAI